MRRPRRAPALDPSVPCDVFTGAVSSNGYGNIMRAGRNLTAHKAAWEDACGPVSAGGELHHVCGHKLCREVRHLELLTRAEHVARHVAARTHCSNGHERTKANTYRCRGVDRCAVCRATSRKRKAA